MSGDAAVEPVLAHLRDQLARGELIAAYDTAERADRDGLDHPLVRYHQVLALARAGATEAAARLYEAAGLGSQPDMDSRTLRARILKDRALATPVVGREAALGEAAEAYLAVHAETGAAYPAINAATLSLLAGRRDAARALAGGLLDDRNLQAGGAYWDAATRAEAHLILGDLAAAERELARARERVAGDWGKLSTTRRQLRLLLGAPPPDPSAERLLELVRPPRVAVLGDAGIMSSEDLATELRIRDVGLAVGTLWREPSVAAAETALRAGIDLVLVLPCGAEHLLAHVAAVAGAGEAERRRACIDAARSVLAVTADGDHIDATLVAYAAMVARGLARIRARRLDTECVDLSVLPHAGRAPDDRPPVGPADPARRELRALLFADAEGFSRLPESDLPAFWSRFMVEMASQLDRSGDVLFRNSWGDAVFCVTTGAEAAASLALAMQERAAELRREHPRSPALRIGLHHGPVFRGWDAVRGTEGYFGTQVSRAARVEPIVPPGDVYVTEPFAAVLASGEGEAFATEYVGTLSLPKDYGEHRMYRLARRRPG